MVAPTCPVEARAIFSSGILSRQHPRARGTLSEKNPAGKNRSWNPRTRRGRRGSKGALGAHRGMGGVDAGEGGGDGSADVAAGAGRGSERPFGVELRRSRSP